MSGFPDWESDAAVKVCFDTCSVIDIVGKTDWFFPAYCAYDVAVSLGFSPCLSVTSTTDVCYLLHSRGIMSRKEARKAIEEVLGLFDLFEITPSDCRKAARSDMDDYEDALIAYGAHSAGIDIIITRNQRDFRKSPVPALAPEDFLRNFKPDDIHYDEVDLFG